MKLLLPLLFLPIAACAQLTQTPKQFTVTVKIDELKPGDTVYLSYTKFKTDEAEDFIDTLIFKADKLAFTGEIPESMEATIIRYRMEKVDTSFLQMLRTGFPGTEEDLKEMEAYFLDPRKIDMISFYLTGGETTVKAARTLAKAKLEGSDVLTTYLKLNKDYERAYKESLSKLDDDFELLSKPDAETQERMFKTVDSIQRIVQRDIYFTYARDNPQSPLSTYALRKSLPKTVDTAANYIAVLDKLDPAIRQGPGAKRLMHMLESIQKTEIGRTIDDFQQVDAKGNQVKFSSFRGKYVLVELWASWCMPCRKKNPGLVKIHQKYEAKNFSILGVALEEKDAKDKWLTAIKKDGLTWPQLTDFKGWKNAVARQFGIQSIPFNVLVDPTGKIIAKNIYDTELDNLLASVLK